MEEVKAAFLNAITLNEILSHIHHHSGPSMPNPSEINRLMEIIINNLKDGTFLYFKKYFIATIIRINDFIGMNPENIEEIHSYAKTIMMNELARETTIIGQFIRYEDKYNHLKSHAMIYKLDEHNSLIPDHFYSQIAQYNHASLSLPDQFSSAKGYQKNSEFIDLEAYLELLNRNSQYGNLIFGNTNLSGKCREIRRQISSIKQIVGMTISHTTDSIMPHSIHF